MQAVAPPVDMRTVMLAVLAVLQPLWLALPSFLAIAMATSTRSQELSLSRLELEPTSLAAFVRRKAAVLHRHRDQARTSRERMGPLLAWLWLGRHDLARAELNAATRASAVPTSDDDAWLLIQHYWTLRATRDHDALATAWPQLAAAAGRVAGGSTEGTKGPSYDGAVLRLQGLACAGLLAAASGDERLQTTFDLRARALLDQLEASYWSPTDGCFADAATGGTPVSLFACSIGMLTTTADRTERHARLGLRQRGGGSSGTSDVEATLVALAQFDGVRATALEALLADPSESPTRAGLAIDAVLFATTGLRMATGPGIDEAWVRLRPFVPSASDRLVVRGLMHDGWTCDLSCDRSGEETVGRYTLHSQRPGCSWRQLVVHQDRRTFVAAAIDGEAIELRSMAVAREDLLAPPTSSRSR